MRITTLLLLSTISFGLSACDYTAKQNTQSADALAKVNENVPREAELTKKQMPETRLLEQQNVSLSDADSANSALQAFDRKIIRNANLTIEVASPLESQRKIFSIAESHGGFVVTSEMSQQATEDKSKPQFSVNLVVRVPASQFEQAVDEIRATGNRILQEKRTGQDVTEEFIDLEARIKNQKALENQLLEIMKRAGKVSDALEVQTQLADVRTEIEKLEGRKRFLENQSSLSTINITLQTPAQIVNAVGFWYNARTAFADGVEVAGAIILFLIRTVLALVPVLVFIVLPLALIAKIGLNVARRHRGSKPVPVTATNE